MLAISLNGIRARAATTVIPSASAAALSDRSKTTARGYLEHAMTDLHFSARAHDRMLMVARKLADLGGSETIRPDDILEAIQFRSLDRKLIVKYRCSMFNV